MDDSERDCQADQGSGKEWVEEAFRDFLSDAGYELTMAYGLTQPEADSLIAGLLRAWVAGK